MIPNRMKGRESRRRAAVVVGLVLSGWQPDVGIPLGPTSGCRVPALDVGPKKYRSNDRRMTAAIHPRNSPLFTVSFNIQVLARMGF